MCISNVSVSPKLDCHDPILSGLEFETKNIYLIYSILFIMFIVYCVQRFFTDFLNKFKNLSFQVIRVEVDGNFV